MASADELGCCGKPAGAICVHDLEDSKPTRDQLLDVLDRVKALAEEEGEANTYIERARLRAVLDLAYETEDLKP